MADEPRAQKLVFLVDDDPDFLEIFGAKLTAAGFNMVTFLDARTAIKEAEEKQPDLIILDVQMPKMSGIAALGEIKSNPKTANLRVLFLTNAGTSEEGGEWLDQKFALEAGALGHIRKSDDLATIASQIIKAMG